MTSDLREKQTTINVQEKANLIWAIADAFATKFPAERRGMRKSRERPVK